VTLAIERRASVRYETVNKQTSVQFMDWTERQITGSKLVNISVTGALIFADLVPALYRPLWVRVENAPGVGWIAAETVRFGRSKDVGIRFYRPCPRYFLLGNTLIRHPDGRVEDEPTPWADW
jgi:hypothetical protein